VNGAAPSLPMTIEISKEARKEAIASIERPYWRKFDQNKKSK
jgi:hypothetical protein